MSMLFRSATAFNQNISEWDISEVYNITNMFLDANNFNQDLSSWIIGASVTKTLNDFTAVNWTLPRPTLQ